MKSFVRQMELTVVVVFLQTVNNVSAFHAERRGRWHDPQRDSTNAATSGG
jgi:hypothetical protein